MSRCRGIFLTLRVNAIQVLDAVGRSNPRIDPVENPCEGSPEGVLTYIKPAYEQHARDSVVAVELSAEPCQFASLLSSSFVVDGRRAAPRILMVGRLEQPSLPPPFYLPWTDGDPGLSRHPVGQLAI